MKAPEAEVSDDYGNFVSVMASHQLTLTVWILIVEAITFYNILADSTQTHVCYAAPICPPTTLEIFLHVDVNM